MYNGIETLKGPGEVTEYTQEMIDEWVKCADDHEYFIENYVKIDDNSGQLVLFALRPYQKKFLRMVHENKFSIAKWPRQSGKSSCMAAYFVWATIFLNRYKIGVASDKDDSAIDIISRFKTAYENVPYWMQQPVTKWDEHKVRLQNGSNIEAAATTTKTFRGRSKNCIMLDEFAFVEQNIADKFYTSIYPTIAQGAENNKIIITSTPNGLNHYFELYDAAEKKENEYQALEVRWDEVPGRDEAFRISTIKNIGQERFDQEFDGNFLGSSTTLIPAWKLKTAQVKDPEDEIDDIKYFLPPRKNHVYFICVDTCRGKGLDFHATSVIDITTTPYEVVATFRNDTMDTMLYPSIVYQLAKYYNDAYVLVELNDAGKQVSDILYAELEYENVLSTITKGRSGQILSVEAGTNMGVTTSKPVKAIGCGNLKSLIMNNRLILNDRQFIRELSKFEIVGDTYKAATGAHDDLVMCLHRRSRIKTEDGVKSIKWIVDNKYKGKVESFDENTGEFVWKRVIGHIARENSGSNKKEWVRVKAKGFTTLITTKDHRYATISDLTNPKIEWHEAKDTLGKFIIRNLNDSDCVWSRRNPLFNKNQLSVLLGILISDGSVNKKGIASVTHGLQQEEYILHKQEILGGNLSYSAERKNIYLQFPTNAQTTWSREILYPNGKKVISHILPYLDEISLAYWYMDDGYITSGGRQSARLCTDSFTYEEHVILKDWFLSKFGISSYISENKKYGKYSGTYFRLNFNTDESEKFFSLIAPYIHESMKYKLPVRFHSVVPRVLDYTPLKYSAGLVREIQYLPTKESWMSKLYDIEVEDTHTFVANDIVVHNCLVLFGWAVSQPYFMELTDMNIREEMFTKRIQQMEEDLVPFGHVPWAEDDDIPADWSKG